MSGLPANWLLGNYIYSAKQWEDKQNAEDAEDNPAKSGEQAQEEQKEQPQVDDESRDDVEEEEA